MVTKSKKLNKILRAAKIIIYYIILINLNIPRLPRRIMTHTHRELNHIRREEKEAEGRDREEIAGDGTRHRHSTTRFLLMRSRNFDKSFIDLC